MELGRTRDPTYINAGCVKGMVARLVQTHSRTVGWVVEVGWVVDGRGVMSSVGAVGRAQPIEN